MEYCFEFLIELYLIRHGMTRGNQEGRYVGRTDESLTHDGRVALKSLKLPKDLLTFSGPMKRCVETAERLFPDKRPLILKEFTEIDFGDFEMHNFEELDGDPVYQRWVDSNGRLDFPNGEKREDFRRRTLSGFYHMLTIVSNMAKDDPAYFGRKSGSLNTKVAAVIHGGNIMVIMSYLTGRDIYDYMVHNGEGYKLLLSCHEADYQLLQYKPIGGNVII